MKAAADRTICAKMMAALFYRVSPRNHTQTHRRAGSRDLAVSGRLRGFRFRRKISPSSDRSVKREQRREIERDPSDKKGTAKRRPRRRERDGKRDANRISATRDAL